MNLSSTAIDFINKFDRVETVTKQESVFEKYCKDQNLILPENLIRFHIHFSGIKFMVGLNTDTYTELNLFDYQGGGWREWNILSEEKNETTYYKIGYRKSDGFEFELYMDSMDNVYMLDNRFHFLSKGIEPLIEEAALVDSKLNI